MYLLTSILLTIFFSLQSFAFDQSIGSFSKGSLERAKELSDEGRGYVKLFQKRERRFGSDTLITALRDISLYMATKFPFGERLQIGDLSQKKGGRISRHASHQNGLDVDIMYFRNDYREQEVEYNGFDEDFVHAHKLSSNFDKKRNWELFKYLVTNYRVNRIFVDKVIKQEMCQYAQVIGEFDSGHEVLRRLRHWKFHGNHMHIRLKCPLSETRCSDQKETSTQTFCR